MTHFYTENLTDFGLRELAILNDTLTTWLGTGLPKEFEHYGVKFAFNKSSGYVFLVNDHYQVAMLNNGRLEIFHSLPYSGLEGFLCDIISENEPNDLNSDDIDYIVNAAQAAGLSIEAKWLVR